MSSLNGLFSGVFAFESWSLSQSYYYFGRVEGAVPTKSSLL